MNRLMIVLAASTGTRRLRHLVPPRSSAASRRGGASRSAETPSAPKPTYGTFGFDTAGMDMHIQAGRRFLRFANGTWAKNTPIPADKSNYGMFNVLDDLSRSRTRETHREAAKRSRTARSASPMPAFSTRPRSRRKGLAPIQPWLDQIRALKSQGRLCRALRRGAAALGIGGPFGAFVGQDDKAPESLRAAPCSSPASACPTAIITCRTTPSWPRRARRICSISTNVLTLAGETECRRARQGDPRFRDRDRRGQLDPHPQPRREQDLQQDDASPSSQTQRAGLRLRRPISSGIGANVDSADRRPAERDHRHRRARRQGADRRCSRTSCWSARSTAIRAVPPGGVRQGELSPSTAPC